MDDDAIPMKENNYLAVIYFKASVYTIGFVDVSTGDIRLTSTSDWNQCVKNARTEEVREPEPFAYFDRPEARLREEKEWKEYFTPSRFGEEAKAETADTEGRVLHTHTVLLSKEMKAEAKHSLRSLDRSREDIALGYFPFVIGKQERVCDYVLHSEEVSRLHLRLDQDGEDCVVTDLNSLNGTKIGGRLLENEESAVIRTGDILEIAGIKYLFS